MPKMTPIIDFGRIGFCSKKYSIQIRINGWVEISNAANPLSTYCSAQTTLPLPIVKNKVPTIALLINCFLVLLLNLPVKITKRKMRIPAKTNLIPANKNGGNSCTIILLNK